MTLRFTNLWIEMSDKNYYTSHYITIWSEIHYTLPEKGTFSTNMRKKMFPNIS